MAAAAGTTPPPATVTLQPFQEYRFETPLLAAEPVSVTLAKGRAEIFGAELAPGRAYTFPPGKAEAVFTFHGCALEIVGRMSHAYVASDTPMPSYLQLHARLDAMRMAGRPPRVLVAGPADTGKSSLCRTLANWMARSGHAGTLVDLDVGAALYCRTMQRSALKYWSRLNARSALSPTAPKSEMLLVLRSAKRPNWPSRSYSTRSMV